MRNDMATYVTYSRNLLRSDVPALDAFVAIIDRLEGRRIPDPDNPTAGFAEMTNRVSCCGCELSGDRARMQLSEHGLICERCVLGSYTRVINDPSVLYYIGNTETLARPVGTLSAGIYTQEFLRETLFYCRHNRRYFGSLDEHTRAGCCADRGKVFIYSYHGTTPIETHGWPSATPKNSLCFGVELEMEHKGTKERDEDEDEDSDDDNADYSDLQKHICRALRFSDGTGNGGIPGVEGRYVLENDGSLNDSGVELVTCPYTLDFHQTRFGWDKLLAEVSGIAMSGKGTTACGMHVHVNRKALSALTLGKMLVFVNAENNTRLVRQVAQRDSERWAERYEKSIRQGKDRNSDKYQAMHLSENTVEFRIFRGNLKPERVLKNIEFVHSVVCYCRAASIQEIESPEGYYKWLFKHRGTYKNLVKFLGIADPRLTDA